VLFIAEGKIHQPIEATDHKTAAAWLGPMVDAGFLQSGYLDAAGQRVLMVLSAPDADAVAKRLDNLPIVHDGSVSFSVSRVTALRFS
jgi:hypothetical protein